MPIYEYLCARCAKVSEVLQKISDSPLTKCPRCGGQVKKLMSQNSFQLKGTGWYATDNRKPAPTETDSGPDSGPAPAGEESAPASSSSLAEPSVAGAASAAGPAGPAGE
ncbi:MAG: zinc ribbon domain-containing protein [Desulfarculales bacterium]|nr:zinc ribbon domain-containing protein [Desulfarculales bacterium]